jgi:hypothetical protein
MQMADRLFVAILGNRNAGKSTTWNHLFDPTGKTTVRTGRNPRDLYLNAAQWVEVFLVSGSPEERELLVGKILPKELPQIVLCSAQYHQDVKGTFDYFFRKDYEIFVQWLNPGYNDTGIYQDDLSLHDYLLDGGATLQVRDGKVNLTSRVRELRQFILGWATYRDLVETEFPV